MKHLRSLREFIAELDMLGEIQQIDAEVDWRLEIGAAIRRSYDLRAPAPLFTAISDYVGSGFRVLGAPGGLSRPALPADIQQRVLARWAGVYGYPVA